MFKKRFQTRPIVETITAGDCLRRRREDLHLPLKELSKELGIRYDYLDGLEGGRYHELPPQVYVRGFIKSYANRLGIDAGQLIKMYNRETSFLSDEELKDKIKKGKVDKPGWKDYLAVTPRLLTFLGSFVIVLVLGYYFSHQINSFNSKPYLFIASPSADEVVKENELWVNGNTEKDAILKINGQEISVGADGGFNQKITLAEGRNVLVVEAKNRFNKTDRREINIVYEKPQENQFAVEEIKDDSAPQAIAQGAIIEETEERSGAVLGVNTAAAEEVDKKSDQTGSAAADESAAVADRSADIAAPEEE